MSFFCFLFVPLLYLFRRSIVSENGSGSVWALLFGSIIAIFQFSLGNIVIPGGFGFSRWLYGFVDIVSLPVLIPLFVYFILSLFKGFDESSGFANFTLLWLIPVAALRSISWSSYNDPILLVLAPLLWTGLAVGISFFISLIFRFFHWYVVIPSVLYILAMPLAAATCYWAFFSQDMTKGLLFFFAVFLPMLISIVLDYVFASRN